MPDPDLHALISLRRLRRAETDQTRRELGDALAREAALAARELEIMRDLDAARGTLSEFDREAFSAWWERMRLERERLAEAMREAASRTAEARAQLAGRRVAETAAEDALGREVMARDGAASRREQAMLEDVARALKRAADARRG
jgi:hypothetical protein